MKVLIIAEKPEQHLLDIQKVMQEINIETEFVEISKFGMFTHGNKTEIIVNDKEIGQDVNGILLQAKASLTQFVEPVLDEFQERGIYCQIKANSYYICYNKPFLQSILNSRNIPAPWTIIFKNQSAVEDAKESYKFPLMFKTFSGVKTSQHMKIENYETLQSIAKSLKGKADSVAIQEYLEGHWDKALVVGKKVFAVEHKWKEESQEHAEKPIASSLSGVEEKTAIKAVNTVGLDIGTVELIEGRVIDVYPGLPIKIFNETLGKKIEKEIADFYLEKLK